MFNNIKIKNTSEKINIAILSIASAFLMILSFPPFNIFGIAFVATVPLNIIIYKSDKVRHLLLSSVLFVFIFFGALLFWVASFMLKETGTLIAFLVLFAIMFLLVVLFYLPAMVLSNKLSKYAPAIRWIIVPAVFTAMEYMRTIGFLGFPWGIIAYSQWKFLPFIQIADMTGTFGVSFLIYLSNSVLANILIYILSNNNIKDSLKKNIKPIVICIVLFSFTLIYGAIKLYTETNSRQLMQKTQMALVQNAFDPNHGWRSIYTSEPAVKGSKGFSGMAERFLLKPEKFQDEETPDGSKQNGTVSVERLAKISKEASLSMPSLIVFSESATEDSYGFYIENYENRIKNLNSNSNSNVSTGIYNTSIIYNTINETSTYYLLGTSLVKDSTNENEKYNYYNGTIFVNTNGKPLDDYAKTLLVPGGEAYPFDSEFWINMPLFGRFVRFVHAEFKKAGAGRWTRGEKFTVYKHPNGYTFSTLICYESAFGDFTRKFVYDGAEALVVITEDAWSYSDNSQWQHFYMSVFRAIENRRDVVQDSNSGVTGHISSTGSIISTLDFWRPGYLIANIALSTKKTVYTIFGEWFVFICFLFVFTLTIISIIAFIKNIKENRKYEPSVVSKLSSIAKNILGLYASFFSNIGKLYDPKKKNIKNIFDDSSDSSLSSFSSIIDDFNPSDNKQDN